MQIYNVVQNILCDIHFKPNKTFKFFILIEPDIHNSLSAFIIVFDIIPKTFRRRKQRHFKYMRYVMFLGDFLQTFPVNRMIDIRWASVTQCDSMCIETVVVICSDETYFYHSVTV